MKHFKKILFTLVLLLGGLVLLTACKPTVDLEAAKTALTIGYAEGETFNTVKSKLTLPASVEGHEGVSVTWTSDKTEVISITGVVVRQEANELVTLTATLKAGEKSVTKEFKVTVLAKEQEEPEPDKTALKTLLDEHYKTTLAVPNFLIETETIDLVTTIGDFTVTWTSNKTDIIDPATGTVTRPPFTGDLEQSVMLTAKAEGQNDVIYIVKVKELEETLENKVNRALNLLTTFPSTYRPILKEPNLGLEDRAKITIDGTDYTATWASDKPEYIGNDGVVNPNPFDGIHEVTMTVTVEVEDVTYTREVKFTVKGVVIHDTIYSLLYGEFKAEKGDIAIIKNVSLYDETNDGYYLVDTEGHLIFSYGKTTIPEADKLFDVRFELDLYYASPQIKSPIYTEVEGGTVNTVTLYDITLQDLVNQPIPSDEKPLLHKAYKVTGSKLHIMNPSNDYQTFLVPQAKEDKTEMPTKADSLMLYYQTPGGLSVLQALADGPQSFSKNFDHIVIIVNAYRTNNNIYAFYFIGDINDEAVLKQTLTPADLAEQALKNAAAKIEDKVLVEENLTLPATETYLEHEYDITYVSDKPEVINNAGELQAGQFPTPGTFVEVKFTMTTQDTEGEEVTYVKTVTLGRDPSITIDQAVAKEENDVVFFEAMWFGVSGGTHVFVDGTSEQGAAVRFPNSYDQTHIVAGKKYLVYATKAADYNGLKQFNGVLAVELSDATITPVEYTKAFTNVELEKVMNQVVKINGLTLVAAPSKASNGVLTYSLKNTAGETISIREHQGNEAVIAAIEALELQAGERVNMVSGVVSWYNNPQFLLVTLEKAPLTPEEQFNEKVAEFKLTLPAENKKYYENFSLAVAHYGLAIAWEVTEGATAAAVDAAGLVTITKGAEEETVKLKGVVTEGEFTADVIVQVIIAKEGEEPSTNVATDLFISEYIEGTSNNKAIEIYNGTGAAVNLSNYRVTLFSNGSSEHHATNIATFTIDQVLNPGETLVIYNSGSSELLKARLTHAAISITSTVTYFNGDDALALEKKNGEAWDRIDVFGVIGVDPGTNWPVGDGSTLDNTLVRNANVGSPSATWDVTQWTVKGKDFFDDLGVHTMTLE